ncbi:MAG: hypothetical protein PHD58_00190, partial [Anaerolineales bacterium]|nr:hypothetical protein [Anaerolineales bacterium]
ELIDTRIRYFRALRLLQHTNQHTVRTIMNIQRDHVNFPNSICNHAEGLMGPLEREKTINAMVMDLTARVMHFAWGNPCVNQYHMIYLENG